MGGGCRNARRPLLRGSMHAKRSRGDDPSAGGRRGGCWVPATGMSTPSWVGLGTPPAQRSQPTSRPARLQEVEGALRYGSAPSRRLEVLPEPAQCGGQDSGGQRRGVAHDELRAPFSIERCDVFPDVAVLPQHSPGGRREPWRVAHADLLLSHAPNSPVGLPARSGWQASETTIPAFPFLLDGIGDYGRKFRQQADDTAAR